MGMLPDTEATPMEKRYLEKEMAVMEALIND